MFGNQKHKYTSNLVLDEVYTDKQTQIGGHLVGLYFYQHGCTRGTIELVVSGKIEGYTFEEPRLDGTDHGQQTYESDIVLGERYFDAQTGIAGVAIAIYFYPNSCERVTIEHVVKGKIEEDTFDVPRLSSVKTPEVKATTTKTGGPGLLASQRDPAAPRR